jgi:hypothetical protein
MDFGHVTYSYSFLCTSNFSPIFFSTSERNPLTVFGINTIKIYSVPQFYNSLNKLLCLVKVFLLFKPAVLKESLTYVYQCS